jgi:hypothetical protein
VRRSLVTVVVTLAENAVDDELKVSSSKDVVNRTGSIFYNEATLITNKLYTPLGSAIVDGTVCPFFTQFFT